MDRCSVCKYARPIDVNVKLLNTIIKSKQEILDEYCSRPILERDFYIEKMFNLGLSQLKDKLREEEMIVCHRFPDTIKKDKTDYCGEFQHDNR